MAKGRKLVPLMKRAKETGKTDGIYILIRYMLLALNQKS